MMIGFHYLKNPSRVRWAGHDRDRGIGPIPTKSVPEVLIVGNAGNVQNPGALPGVGRQEDHDVLYVLICPGRRIGVDVVGPEVVVLRHGL